MSKNFSEDAVKSIVEKKRSLFSFKTMIFTYHLRNFTYCLALITSRLFRIFKIMICNA